MTSDSSDKSGTHSFPEEDLRIGGKGNPGYYPVWLGQRLEEGRYCIVRKLGWGQISSVWLARDLKLGRFGSLKILTRDGTLSIGVNSDDFKMLEKIAVESQHLGRRHVLAHYRTFKFDGRDGTHLCIVNEALSYRLEDYRSDGTSDKRVSLFVVKAVVNQILLGLFAHYIKFDNILFRPDDLDLVVYHDLAVDPSTTYICDTKIRPSVIPVRSQILTNSIGPQGQGVNHSHWQDQHFQEIIQPFYLRAPEITLGHKWDTSADIWNLGCVVFELLAGVPLFRGRSGISGNTSWSSSEDMLVRMTETLGEAFETTMLEHCKHKDNYFSPDGSFRHFVRHKEPNQPLYEALAHLTCLQEDEILSVEKFLRRCLVLTPARRATARELSDDLWLTDPLQ
ncbi:kinase-like protein [Ramaria rubella]|nr:kinase-like protein [Ramaria rubella]